jgi:carbamate kinase
MGPKVEAACRFVETTGRVAAIGSLEQAAAIAAGHAGTHVVPGMTGLAADMTREKEEQHGYARI